MTTKAKAAKKQKPETPVAETVRTLDGEDVLASSALVLSYQRVLGAKKSVKNPGVQQGLQGLLTTLSRDPRNLCVSAMDTPKAKELTGLIEPIRIPAGVRKNVLKMKEEDKLSPLWVELLPVLKDWNERQAKYVAERAESDKKAKELAAEKVKEDEAKAKAKAEARKAQAEGLAAFVSSDVTAEAAERAEQGEQNELVYLKLREWLLPFVEGRGTVDRNGRPTSLTANEVERQLLSFDDLAERVKYVGDAKEVEVECAFCGAVHKLGETTTFQRWNRETKEKEPVVIYLARQVFVPCRTAVYEDRETGKMSGGDEYTYKGGPRAGQPKSVAMPCCLECANVARDLSRELSLKGVWVQDIFPAFCNFRERAAERQRDSVRGFNQPRFKGGDRPRR